MRLTVYLCNNIAFIMYQNTGVGNIIGMEIGNFEVVCDLRLGKLFARNSFHFAKRAVGKKNFIAVLQAARILYLYYIRPVSFCQAAKMHSFFNCDPYGNTSGECAPPLFRAMPALVPLLRNGANRRLLHPPGRVTANKN